jgi:hypothetical protein
LLHQFTKIIIDELIESQTSWIVVLIFILFGIILSMLGHLKDYNFSKKSLISMGIIYDMESVSRKNRNTTKFYYETQFHYKYKVNGNIYNGISELKSGHSDRYRSFKNKTFPLLYNPSDPEKSYLLITKSDYAKFVMTMPDSMIWAGDNFQYE